MQSRFVVFAIALALLALSVRPAAAATAAGEPEPKLAVAILREPGMPVRGAASSAETLAVVFRGAGLRTRLISAEELADPKVFSVSNFQLVVIPTGQTFPVVARPTLLAFLHARGNLLTTGGYAFSNLVRKVDGKWLPEADVVKTQLERATAPERSLLPNGGFETRQELPVDGSSMEGQWHRASDRCKIVGDCPQEGCYSAMVSVPPDGPNPGSHYWLDLPPKPGATYLASGWIRVREVGGRGMAYIAVYQHDAQGNLVEFRDFAVTRGTAPWHRYEFKFTPKPRVARLHLTCGLYDAHGTAWFDDIRLSDITGIGFEPMNTASGAPGDGLAVSPDQLGMFDASFALKRVTGLAATAAQQIVRRSVHVKGPLEGWAASGVVGYDQARWVPLLEAFDRYGRPRRARARCCCIIAGRSPVLAGHTSVWRTSTCSPNRTARPRACFRMSPDSWSARRFFTTSKAIIGCIETERK